MKQTRKQDYFFIFFLPYVNLEPLESLQRTPNYTIYYCYCLKIDWQFKNQLRLVNSTRQIQPECPQFKCGRLRHVVFNLIKVLTFNSHLKSFFYWQKYCKNMDLSHDDWRFWCQFVFNLVHKKSLLTDIKRNVDTKQGTCHGNKVGQY